MLLPRDTLKTGFGKSIIFLDCSKRGCEVRPLRGAMVVSKAKIITINNNDHITEVLYTGMFIWGVSASPPSDPLGRSRLKQFSPA